MNFLAHAYLSFGKPEILVGNLIADMIKGKQIDLLPESIQKGIYIHRQIDSFTDKHPVIIKTAEIFQPSAGRYASPFLDVAYDHFLATNASYEPVNGWQPFADNCYAQVELYGEVLPQKFCSMFLYMKSENWLYNYRYTWMIERSFERLKRRANYLSEDAPVFEDFERFYSELEDSFSEFFPSLEEYVKSIS